MILPGSLTQDSTLTHSRDSEMHPGFQNDAPPCILLGCYFILTLTCFANQAMNSIVAAPNNTGFFFCSKSWSFPLSQSIVPPPSAQILYFLILSQPTSNSTGKGPLKIPWILREDALVETAGKWLTSLLHRLLAPSLCSITFRFLSLSTEISEKRWKRNPQPSSLSSTWGTE